MEYIVAGLGNPGEEYAGTRHNIGRMVVEHFAAGYEPSWRDDQKLRARTAKLALASGDTARLVLPENYMNRSGGALAPLVTSEKKAERLIVVHDDIDLPLGSMRIVFDRGAGGHNGVRSIVRALKTQAFIRIRIGVVPTTPSGKLKKPSGEEAVHDFILSAFTKKEQEVLRTLIPRAAEALSTIITEGVDAAQREYN